MAKNLYSLQLLRSTTQLYADRAAAYAALSAKTAQDGVPVLARYLDGNDVKTLVGFYAVAEDISGGTGKNNYMTIIDVEGAAADVDALEQKIEAILGGGVSSANTVSNQLAALSGTPGASSADTSVEGAKAYADEKISQAVSALDYTGVTTGDGVYVTNVTENNGFVSATTATLPTVNDTASAKTFVTSVSEDKGEISATKGTITSSGKTIVLSDNADGGVNFEANVDGATIIIDENTGTMSVASSALVQYEGDDDTVQIGAVSDGKRIVSSPLTIQKVTSGLSEEVKEEYHLVGHSGNTIGDPVKIYKDSHIVSINYISDPADDHYQNLEYVYVNDSGVTSTTYVDMSQLVLEAEFASGLTIENHVARGVVDPTSETFLTVGAGGFKLSGVQGAINTAVGTAISGLDATVTAETANQHVSIQIDEVDGKLTAVTLTEANIANADDLAALSSKTVTAISGLTDEIETRQKIEGQSGDTYSANTGSSYISGATNMNDADIKLAEAIKDIDDIFVSGATMNGSGITASNHVLPFVIEASNTYSEDANAIHVATDANGAVTLSLGTLDCGTY